MTVGLDERHDRKIGHCKEQRVPIYSQDAGSTAMFVDAMESGVLSRRCM